MPDSPADKPEGEIPTGPLDATSDTPPSAHPTRMARKTPQPEDIASHFPQLEIIEILGQGGMGVVYKARQLGLDRLVALKILPREAGEQPGFEDRFTREARALAKLSHSGIVTVHDSGEADGLFYFLMEFVEGANLRRFVDRGATDPDKALSIVTQVCAALEYAHDEGVMHRDIKPENILVDQKGRVKLADFGLAKLLQRKATDITLTAAQQVMGTPYYMAPEQTERPLEVDHRADLYSLGVVLYELLTGELPLGRFPLPSDRCAVSAAVDDIVIRALEKDVDKRYPSAADMRAAIELSEGSRVARPLPPGSSVVGHAVPTQTPRPATPSQSSQIGTALDQIDVAHVLRAVSGPASWLYAFALISLILQLAAWAVLTTVSLAGAGEPEKLGWTAFGLGVTGVMSGFTMFAAGRMKRLESRPLVFLGAILAVLPTQICWAPMSMIVGIWVLIVLNRRDVAAGFRIRAAEKPGPGIGWIVGFPMAFVVVAGLSVFVATR